MAATSNNTDGWFAGGQTPTTSVVNRITFATDTNTASIRGPLNEVRRTLGAAAGIQ